MGGAIRWGKSRWPHRSSPRYTPRASVQLANRRPARSGTRVALPPTLPSVARLAPRREPYARAGSPDDQRTTDAGGWRQPLVVATAHALAGSGESQDVSGAASDHWTGLRCREHLALRHPARWR